jgi:hypothetical protein
MKKKNRNLGLAIFLIVWVVILFLPYFVMRPTIKNIQKDMAVRAEKFAIVKSNSYLCIEQKSKEMSKKEMRKKVHELMLKNNVDMVSLPANVAMLVGLEYITFKGKNDIQGINFDEEYVSIPDDDIEDVYNAVRRELSDIHLYELSEAEVKKLQSEIVMGSYYLADYANSLGVSATEVSNYAYGYLEVADEYDYSFYDYIQSVEFCE